MGQPPPPYLVHVSSKPTKVPAAIWIRVHACEHLPDLVKSKTCDSAAFYREVSGDFNSNQVDPESFLALYYTSFQEPLTSDNYAQGVRPTSDLFKEAGSDDSTIKANGSVDARNYVMIQAYDGLSSNHDSSAADRYVLTVEMDLSNDGMVEDPRDLFVQAYLPQILQVAGHEQSVLYELGEKAPLMKTTPVGRHLAIHHASSATVLSSHIFWPPNHDNQQLVVRGWKLIHSEI